VGSLSSNSLWPRLNATLRCRIPVAGGVLFAEAAGDPSALLLRVGLGGGDVDARGASGAHYLVCVGANQRNADCDGSRSLLGRWRWTGCGWLISKRLLDEMMHGDDDGEWIRRA
jgi:hypothetical protein